MLVGNAVISDGMSQDQLDVIWEMGVASFPANNGALILPELVAAMLNKKNVEYLKSLYRYGLQQSKTEASHANFSSDHFNLAPIIYSVNPTTQALHITLAPVGYVPSENSVPGSSSSYPSTASELLSRDTSPESSADPSLDGPDLTQAVDLTASARLPGKKSKVPRPPNAFILYRQTHHPLLKSSQPLLQNNQISIILGKQWKAEPEDVKNKFRLMADILKNKHAAENPGYQYAPRKPSEKKRRMTARKASQIQSSKQSNNWDSSIEAADTNFGISATNYLGSERYTFPSYLQSGERGDLSLAMPTGHNNVQADYDTTMSPRHPTSAKYNFRIPESRDQIQARLAQHAANAHSFMNELIDWDGIRADAAFIRTTTNRTTAELEALGVDADVLALETDLQCFEFQDDFDELLRLFE